MFKYKELRDLSLKKLKGILEEECFCGKALYYLNACTQLECVSCKMRGLGVFIVITKPLKNSREFH